MNKKLLNIFKKQVVSTLNENGITISSQFHSKSDFNDFVINLCVMTTSETLGISISEALDLVLGEGTVNLIHEELINKVQQS